MGAWRTYVIAAVVLVTVASCGSGESAVPVEPIGDLVTTTTTGSSVPDGPVTQAEPATDALPSTTMVVRTTIVASPPDSVAQPVQPAPDAVGIGSVLIDPSTPVSPMATITDYADAGFDETWSICSVVAVGSMTQVITNTYTERSSDADLTVTLPPRERNSDGIVFDLSEVIKSPDADMTTATVLVPSSEVIDGEVYQVDDEMTDLALPGLMAPPGQVNYLLCLTEYPQGAGTFVPHTPAGLSPLSADGHLLNPWFGSSFTLTVADARKLAST